MSSPQITWDDPGPQIKWDDAVSQPATSAPNAGLSGPSRPNLPVPGILSRFMAAAGATLPVPPSAEDRSRALRAPLEGNPMLNPGFGEPSTVPKLIQGMYQRAKSGDVAGALGEATGNVAQVAAIQKVGSRLAGQTATAQPQPSAPMPRPAAVEMLTNAINPIAKEMPAVRQQLGAHLDAIADTAKSQNIPITDRASLARATQATAQAAHDQFGELLNRAMAVDQRQPVPGKPWETTKSLSQLQGRLTEINAQLYPKYQKGGVAGQAAVAADPVALQAEAAGIRTELYGRMGDALGIEPQAIAKINQRAGALRDLADTVQFYTDEALHAENKLRQAPIDLHTTATGMAVRGLEKAVGKVRGSPADTAVKAAFSQYNRQ